MENELTQYQPEQTFEKNLVRQDQGQLSVETSRSLQEVQGQIVMAKKFPRSIPQVLANILEACKRKGLAETAMYSYPRGGQQVTGPSIRLAEELARNFGNLDYGVKELENKDGESVVMAYCWDLETNVRQTKVFTVKHERYSKKKGIEKLTESRDIYELIANNGARRMRACVLGVIPGYIVEEAVDACDRTMRETVSKEPLSDRIAKMIASFKEFGVTQEMIETRLGHKIEATNPTEVVSLGKIFNSLKDGQSGVADWFSFKQSSQPSQEKAQDLNERLKKPKNFADQLQNGEFPKDGIYPDQGAQQ